MPLELSFMEEDDIPAFAVIDSAAMANWGVAKAMDMANTTGEPRQQMVERWTRRGFQNDSQQVWLKVTDTESSDLVAAALWRFRPEGVPENPPPRLGADSARAGKGDGQTHPVPNVMSAMGRIGDAFNKEFIGEQPHAHLSILVTDPKYQRRGAASMLVRWGCEEADKRGMVANLMATQAGLSLYLKHGFRVVSETPLDLRPFGVDETELRRGMVRPAKVKCES